MWTPAVTLIVVLTTIITLALAVGSVVSYYLNKKYELYVKKTELLVNGVSVGLQKVVSNHESNKPVSGEDHNIFKEE